MIESPDFLVGSGKLVRQLKIANANWKLMKRSPHRLKHSRECELAESGAAESGWSTPLIYSHDNFRNYLPPFGERLFR